MCIIHWLFRKSSNWENVNCNIIASPKTHGDTMHPDTDANGWTRFSSSLLKWVTVTEVRLSRADHLSVARDVCCHRIVWCLVLAGNVAFNPRPRYPLAPAARIVCETVRPQSAVTFARNGFTIVLCIICWASITVWAIAKIRDCAWYVRCRSSQTTSLKFLCLLARLLSSPRPAFPMNLFIPYRQIPDSSQIDKAATSFVWQPPKCKIQNFEL